MMFLRFSFATRCACFDEICDGRQAPDARRVDAEAQVVERAPEVADAPLFERVLFLRRRERRLHRRHQVVEDDARRQQRADAGQHLQQLERIDVLLAAQQHARAARQNQRILAEERLDRLQESRGSRRSRGCGRCAGRSRRRSVADRNRPAHAADRVVALEHGRRIAELRQPPGGRHAGRAGARITIDCGRHCAQRVLISVASRRRRSSTGSPQTAGARNGSVKPSRDPEAVAQPAAHAPPAS